MLAYVDVVSLNTVRIVRGCSKVNETRISNTRARSSETSDLSKRQGGVLSHPFQEKPETGQIVWGYAILYLAEIVWRLYCTVAAPVYMQRARGIP